MPEGSNTSKAIRMPLRIGWTFISTVAMKNPTTTHITIADILASHVSFLRIIGITSIIPAARPRRIPINTDFMCDNYRVSYTLTIFKKLGQFSFAITSYILRTMEQSRPEAVGSSV